MTDDHQMSLQEWVDTLSAQLGADYSVDEESMHIILDLARDAAHEVLRPAAPLTTFLVGVAVGRGAALGAVAAQATQIVQDRTDEDSVGDID